jgi:hypothetical protein
MNPNIGKHGGRRARIPRSAGQQRRPDRAQDFWLYVLPALTVCGLVAEGHDENQPFRISQATARAFETLSERLSNELEDAFNQIAQLMGRAQKQQTKSWPSLVGKRQQ